MYLRPLLGKDDRENNSAHSWLVHVFTRPGSKPEVSALPSQVCSTLKSGHRPAGPACPHRAIQNRLNKTPVKSLVWKKPQVGFFFSKTEDLASEPCPPARSASPQG